jgi:DNA replication protein DnaC
MSGDYELPSLLASLQLRALPAQLPALLAEARSQQMTYEGFLQRVLVVEVQERRRRAQERRLRAAKVPGRKSLEAFDFSFQPTLSERVVRELAGLSFIQSATNVIFLGPPGVGKTHLSLALLIKALEAGYSALYTTLAQVVQDLEAAQSRVTRRCLLGRLTQPRVLLLDEIGYTRLSVEQAQFLFEIVTARYETNPILLTSNTSFAEWGGLLGNEVLATALLDRLLHHAQVISINGSSYRMKERLPLVRLPSPLS